MKDFDPLVLVFYFLGALVGLLLWRLVRLLGKSQKISPKGLT